MRGKDGGVAVRYTQKDVCRVFDIGRDTLRHYERMGIIEPEVAKNGYRYYDDWQINLLWDCKRYQSMGFSLAQIREILHGDGLADVRRRVDVRMAEMEREFEYRQMTLDAMHTYCDMLEGIEARMGAYEVRDVPTLRFVPRRKVHDLLLDDSLDKAGRFVNENQAVCLPPCVHFPNVRDERYFWGFAMPEDRYLVLGGPNEGFVELAAGRALTTCVDAGERWHFGKALFEGLLEEAQARGEVPCGMLYGLLLTRTYDADGGYHRYVEAVLPLAH